MMIPISSGSFACLRHFHVPFEANAVRTFIAKAYEKDEMGNNPFMKARSRAQ